MLWNRRGIPARSVSPHSKLSILCAFMRVWGGRSETENDFQGYFLFLRLILTIWNQYRMLGYCVFKIICMSLEQDTCNVCICRGRAQLLLSHQFVKPSRKKQVLLIPEGFWHVFLSAGSPGLITFSSSRTVCEQALQNSLFLNFAFGGWAELSPAPEAGWQVTWVAQDRAGGKVRGKPAVTGWAVSLGKKEHNPICPCSARACEIALTPMWHGCGSFCSLAVISSGSTCPCSLMLLKTKFITKGCNNGHLDTCICL